MLKKLIFVLLLILSHNTPLHAGPAAPDPIDIQQPDGNSIRARIHGDEFQNWTEADDTGHTILHNKETGYWEYAEQAKDGTLKTNGMRVLPKGLNVPSSLPKSLRPLRNKDLEQRMQNMQIETYQQRSSSSVSQSIASPGAENAVGDWGVAPVSGPKNLLVVLVNFSNRSLGTTPSNWNTNVFDGAAKSVAKYFKENSFNSTTILPVAHTQVGSPVGVISVTVSDAHPDSTVFNFSRDQTWGNHALQQAASFVDFNGLDANADGKLDTSEIVIYFIAAGYEASANTGLHPYVWAHASWTSGTGLTAGTKNIQRWAQSGEYYNGTTYSNGTTQMPMGVIAHELGHQLFGLPDLYDISSQNQGLGNFSLMASGSWGGDTGETGGVTPTVLDAWSREYLGWSNPVIPIGSGPISLAASLVSPSSVYKLVIPATSATEYFLFENRQPTGWDLGLKRYLGNGWLGGLLITHIDNTSGTSGSNDINSYTVNSTIPGHQGVLPVQASTASCEMLSVGASCRGHATTLFYSGNNATWSSLSTPNSNFYNGTDTNFSLTGISAPASTMTANLSLVPPVLRTISVTKSGNGSGTVTSSSAGISCGATCSGTFYDNTVVTLTAMANPGSVFAGWTGGGCGGASDCPVSVSADMALTATFVTPLFSENFDGVATPLLPSSWLSSWISGNATASWKTSINDGGDETNATSHSAANHVFFNSYDQSGGSAILASPAFSLTGVSGGKVKFWMYRDSGFPSYTDILEVYSNTSVGLSGATLLGSINRVTTLSPAVAGTGWYEYAYNLPIDLTGSTNYVVFKGISAFGNNIHLDDISVFGVANPVVSPTATSVPATFISATTATLNGTVSDGGAVATVTFQYGLTSGYGSTAPGGAVSAGAGNSPVNAAVSGLACNTTYHFRVNATNSAGTTNGNDLTFTTNACPPAATTIHAENITETAATLEGLVTDGGALATVTFEYGLTSAYGSFLSGGTVNAGSGSTSVNATISGLICGAQYHFRVSATNSAGTTNGDDANFTTSICPLLRVGEVSYQTLQSGYNADESGLEIKLLAGAEVGALTVNQANKNGIILIKGGYDPSFTTDSGQATILGAVTLSDGTTKFHNVKIR